ASAILRRGDGEAPDDARRSGCSGGAPDARATRPHRQARTIRVNDAARLARVLPRARRAPPLRDSEASPRHRVDTIYILLPSQIGTSLPVPSPPPATR